MQMLSPDSHHHQYTITNESQLPSKVDDLIKAQLEDPLLGALHNHLSKGTQLPKIPPGLHHCFLEGGVLCRHYKESVKVLVALYIYNMSYLRHFRKLSSGDK